MGCYISSGPEEGLGVLGDEVDHGPDRGAHGGGLEQEEGQPAQLYCRSGVRGYTRCALPPREMTQYINMLFGT